MTPSEKKALIFIVSLNVLLLLVHIYSSIAFRVETYSDFEYDAIRELESELNDLQEELLRISQSLAKLR